MKCSWIVFFLLASAAQANGMGIPKPIHSCVTHSYAIRIFPLESVNHRVEIRGADLSLLNLPIRALIPNRDKLRFPIGKPRFECASISPDGSDYLETIRVYDGYVEVLKAVPAGLFAPLQYEIDRPPTAK